MSKPSIKKLSSMSFTKMGPAREEHIAQAPAFMPPAVDTYTPNQIAAALHPQVQHVKIDQVIDRGPKFKSFVLAPDAEAGTEALAYFDAGQYLVFEIEMPNGAVVRPYSICSSPEDALNGTYQITVERVAGGYANDFVWDNWTVGTKLNVSAPQGEFSYEPLRDAPSVVAMVGGSAITPIHSMARAIMQGTEDFDLTILYGTNALEDAVLQDELKEIADACPKVKLVNVLCNEQQEGCEHGFITLDLVRKYAPEGKVSYFVCGPAAMRNAVNKWLPDLGVAPKYIRGELFGEYRNPESDADYPGNGTPGNVPAEYALTVRMAGEEYAVTCNSHDTLLNSMEHAGIHAPAHCRSGECGWCHSRLVSGEVYVPAQIDGRRAADKKFGYVHPCGTFPLSDIVLDVPPFAY